jgi:hypothetical protein
LYANPGEQGETQRHSAPKQLSKLLTETNSGALGKTQLNWAPKSAKPLFVGSIPTAASFRFKKLRAAEGLPVLVCVPVVCQLNRRDDVLASI